MTTLVILNPNAGGGRGRREWADIARRLERAIGPFEAKETRAPGDAADFAAKAAEEGASLVVSVGGDGTLNETANGLATAPEHARPDLGVVNCGTGGDFRRTFGIEAGPRASIERLAKETVRKIDLGRIEFLDHDGGPCVRRFINIASFGLSGLTDRVVNRAQASKRIGGRLVFFGAALAAIARYRAPRVRLTFDHAALEAPILTAAVCNGRFFGAGMMIAPHAEPDDGFFDVVVLRKRPKLAVLGSMRKIYSGAHLGDPSVSVHRARELTAEIVEDEGAPVLLDADGEVPGRLPARFTIEPGALKVRL